MKKIYKVKPLTEGKENIIPTLIEEYDIKMEAEMDEHIGYEKYQPSDTTNYRNGVKKKNPKV